MVWCIYFTKAKEQKNKRTKNWKKILCIALDTSVTAFTNNKKKLCSRASLGCRVDFKFSFFKKICTVHYCLLLHVSINEKIEKKMTIVYVLQAYSPLYTQTPSRIEGLLYFLLLVGVLLSSLKYFAL